MKTKERKMIVMKNKKKVMLFVLILFVFGILGMYCWEQYKIIKEQEKHIVSVFDVPITKEEEEYLRKKHHLMPFGGD